MAEHTSLDSSADLISVATTLLCRKQTVATMESITSGGAAQLLTSLAGASAYLKYGWVTYSNEAKIAAGVPEEIVANGVYSGACAEAMANCARKKANADFGIGITGVAGPGESDGVDAGNVWFCVCKEEVSAIYHMVFPGDRSQIREAATTMAVHLLAKFLERQ